MTKRATPPVEDQQRTASVREAAVELALSEVWVRRLIASERLAATRAGARVVVPVAELRRFKAERAARSASRSGDEEWASERLVLATVAGHLERQGWTVIRMLDPDTREHGVDLVLERGTARMAVEAKGFPGPVYTKGDRAGERKRWRHPAARSYMGDLLLEALLVPESEPGALVAIALPAKTTFVTLIRRLDRALAVLGLGVFLVHRSGEVETVRGPNITRW